MSHGWKKGYKSTDRRLVPRDVRNEIEARLQAMNQGIDLTPDPTCICPACKRSLVVVEGECSRCGAMV